MILRYREEPMEIKLFRLLYARMKFPEKEVKYFKNLMKGFEGEKKSDIWLEGLSENFLVIHGLLLEYYNSKFQIDTLLIQNEKIFALDIKNYEGDHYLEDDKWFTLPRLDYKNPLHQLSRCETLLQKLLKDLGYQLPIESYLIFNNPEFHLYSPTIHPEIIFPTQLNRFLKKLNSESAKFTNHHLQLGEKLVSLHKIESPYEKLPAYTYEQLDKFILCPNCLSSSFEAYKREKLICKKCSFIEDAESAVLRNVDEYISLFPNRKVTTNDIYDWCGGIKSKKVIRKYLSRGFKQTGHRISSKYVTKSDNDNRIE